VNSTAANYTVSGGTQVGSTSTTGWNTADFSGTNYNFIALKLSTASAAYLSTITIEYDPASISLTSTTLSGFTYTAGAGPSAEKSFNVSGYNLTNDIVLTAPTEYEMSITSGSGYVASITLTKTGGSVASTPIYVRLKSGLSADDYNKSITVASTNATTQTVACSGSVVVATGINTPEAGSVKVFASEGKLYVNGAEAGTPVQVYTTTGSLVKSIVTSSNANSFVLPKGLYLVKVGGESVKVVVR
jgi:hypothetical protein